jgi:transglutaminase-like putative cysteine protease
VLVPGGGWRGFDPSEGLAVGDRHVVVAAASKPRDAAPIIGAFRGTGTQSQMQVAIQLTAA